MTRPLLMLSVVASVAVSACAPIQTAPLAPVKRVIEFGWDQPDAAFLRRHVATMEQLPFDGCVFSVRFVASDGTSGDFANAVWGTRAFTERDVGGALLDLRATPLTRFTHNFLRFNVLPGTVDWFDDFSAILANARLAGHVARQGGAKGILFDIEQYDSPVFEYAKQRDATRRSWDEYARQARGRGRELIEAFQRGYPGLTVFLTWGYSGPWLEMRRSGKTLREAEYGLLAPFLDGMVDGARGATRLVDGYEPTYYHEKNVAAFAAARGLVRDEVLPIVENPVKYREVLSVAFAVWLDFESPPRPWDGADGARNYYTPEQFERSLRAALAAADEYVWIYTQTPRWWSADGSPAQLPAAYVDALRRARHSLAP